MYNTFDPDLKQVLINCGFNEERFSPVTDRMVKSAHGKTFSAVPWALTSLGDVRLPAIWLGELSSRADIYASNESEINNFVNGFKDEQTILLP